MAAVYLAIRLSEVSKTGNEPDFSWRIGKCTHIMQSAAASDYTKIIYCNIQHQHYAQQLWKFTAIKNISKLLPENKRKCVFPLHSYGSKLTIDIASNDWRRGDS